MGRIVSGGLKGVPRGAYRAEKPYDIEPEGVTNQAEEAPPGFDLSTAARGVARTAARVGETVAGLPADILSGGVNLLSKATGGYIPTTQQLAEKDKERGVPSFLQLPTSERFREGTRALTGEYLEPKNEYEELGDEFTSLVSALVAPAKGVFGLLGKGAEIVGKVPRALKIAGTAIGAGEAVKYATGSEKAKEYTKLGVLLASGLTGGREVLEKKAKEGFEKAKSVPGSITVKAPELESSVKSIEHELGLGSFTKHKQEVKKFVDDVNKSFEKGTKHTFKGGRQIIEKAIPIEELVQLEKDANEIIRDYNVPKKAEPYILKLKEEFNKALNDYGKTDVPWNEAYQESKEIYYGLKQRSKLNAFLEDHTNIEELLKSKTAKSILFGGYLSSHISPEKLAGAFAAGKVSSAVHRGVRFGEFIYNSPTALKYYKGAMAAALKNDVGAFTQSAKRLDKVAQDFDKDHPESTIEESFEPSHRKGRIVSGGLKSS